MIFAPLGKLNFAALPCKIPKTWQGQAQDRVLEQQLSSTGDAQIISGHAQSPEAAPSNHVQGVYTVYLLPCLCCLASYVSPGLILNMIIPAIKVFKCPRNSRVRKAT